MQLIKIKDKIINKRRRKKKRRYWLSRAKDKMVRAGDTKHKSYE